MTRSEAAFRRCHKCESAMRLLSWRCPKCGVLNRIYTRTQMIGAILLAFLILFFVGKR
jgi:lipopolysaccharide biosynthesis regulator YciM